jgi:hypothetical protein
LPPVEVSVRGGLALRLGEAVVRAGSPGLRVGWFRVLWLGSGRVFVGGGSGATTGSPVTERPGGENDCGRASTDHLDIMPAGEPGIP